MATNPAPLSHGQQSIYDLMQSTLKSWGLSTLAGQVKKLIVGGDTSPDTLSLALSQTPEFKARFAGNEARLKAGLKELTPAEYIATEEQYRETLNRYGVPAGFYDDKAATDKWIGGDVSPNELNDRVQSVANLIYNSPPEALQAWHNYYGGSGTGGAIAAVLDPTKAAPVVEQQVAAAQIGGSALQQGLSTSAANAQRYASEGVTLAQAQKAYGDIAQRLTTDQAASARFGMQFGQPQEEAATLENNAPALQQQSTLYAEEQSMFAGHGGSATAASSSPGSNY